MTIGLAPLRAEQMTAGKTLSVRERRAIPSHRSETSSEHRQPEKGNSVTLLGTILRNNRPKERNYAWNQTNLVAPDTLEVTSDDFVDGDTLQVRHAGRRVGGENVSPHLAWGLTTGFAELLLVVEDIDSPISPNPAVHCLALVDESNLDTPHTLPAGALAKQNPIRGVTLLRSTIGRGYHGPEPIKGHGPHRYVFELYVLSQRLLEPANRESLLKARPRSVLSSIGSGVTSRGRITGVYER